MLIGSIVAFFLAVILFVVFLFPPSLATAQQQTTTTAPTISSPPSSLSITTPLPLTPEEQAQQNRLQNVIAATTRDLNETEKEVSGVVFTPRWSDVAWINANSISVLIAYCLPGEFADSGQEILGGFGLEVLESYAVDLPQGFMAWMAVVGNEDIENRRLPAALGVICASDLNRAETRVLSPQEQQKINNVISQFSTIQNTQVTNIDQVINIINNVTSTPPALNETGGGTAPTTGQPLKAEIIPNATEGVAAAAFQFQANITGGTEPLTTNWNLGDGRVLTLDEAGRRQAVDHIFQQAGTYNVVLTVYDSKNQTAYDSVQITTDPPLTARIVANATQGFPGDTIKFDANIIGGRPPYTYRWHLDRFGPIDAQNSFIWHFPDPGTYAFQLIVYDSKDQSGFDAIQITIKERPQGGGLLGEGIIDNATVAGEGRGGETSSRQEEGGGGVLPPQPPTVPEEGEPTTGEEDTGVTPPETGEEPSPPSPPPDDTGEEGEGESPPSTTEEEPTTPPEGGG